MSEKIFPPQTPYRRRLSDMLDLTYELEGLLHIGVTRSEVPQRLNQLIVAKLNAIVALADNPATPEELANDDNAHSLSEDSEPSVPETVGEDDSDDVQEEDDVVQEEDLEREAAPDPVSHSAGDHSENDSREVRSERGRLFSINDRFFYARELFGGELNNFDAAINEVITFDSYEEAEEYFISEWGFDPESPTAIKFLGVISHLF